MNRRPENRQQRSDRDGSGSLGHPTEVDRGQSDRGKADLPLTLRGDVAANGVDRMLDCCCGDRALVSAEAVGESLFADVVHRTRDSGSRFPDTLEVTRREQILLQCAGALKPRLDVLLDVLGRQRLEPRADADSLPDLPHVMLSQLVFELRLPAEHDLENFLLGRFEIGQQTQILENLVIEGLGIVDDHDNVPSCDQSVEEIVVQARKPIQPARIVEDDPQLHADEREQLIEGHPRIEQHRERGFRPRFLDNSP